MTSVTTYTSIKEVLPLIFATHMSCDMFMRLAAADKQVHRASDIAKQYLKQRAVKLMRDKRLIVVKADGGIYEIEYKPMKSTLYYSFSPEYNTDPDLGIVTYSASQYSQVNTTPTNLVKPEEVDPDALKMLLEQLKVYIGKISDIDKGFDMMDICAFIELYMALNNGGGQGGKPKTKPKPKSAPSRKKPVPTKKPTKKPAKKVVPANNKKKLSK
jgi:hypothetical protein